jgi:hypothetical protein
MTGDSDEIVEQRFTGQQAARYTDALSSLNSVRLVYRATDMDGIATELRSFEAVYGAYPDVIFIDNLMDYVEAAGEWELMRTMTRELDVAARETKAHICVLHHTSEAAVPPGVVPPLSAIQGKVSQKARLTLTIAARGMSLGLACVKNSNGPQDPTGRNSLQFFVQPSLRVEDVSFRSEVR